MRFTKFVELGRLVYISEGKYRGKLAMVVDIIGHNRLIVDGPLTGVPRHEIRLRHVQLTKLCEKVKTHTPTKEVQKVWAEKELTKRWEGTRWFRASEAAKKRKSLTDFERFKLRYVKRHRNHIRTLAYKKLLKQKVKEGVFKSWTKKQKEAARAAKLKAKA